MTNIRIITTKSTGFIWSTKGNPYDFHSHTIPTMLTTPMMLTIPPFQDVLDSLQAKLGLKAVAHFSLVVEHVKSLKRNKLTLLNPRDTLAKVQSPSFLPPCPPTAPRGVSDAPILVAFCQLGHWDIGGGKQPTGRGEAFSSHNAGGCKMSPDQIFRRNLNSLHSVGVSPAAAWLVGWLGSPPLVFKIQTFVHWPNCNPHSDPRERGF